MNNLQEQLQNIKTQENNLLKERNLIAISRTRTLNLEENDE